MSDRIAVFNEGRIEQFASPLEIYRRPATAFVGAFVGDSNFLDIELTDPRAGRGRSEIAGDICVPGSEREPGSHVRLLIRPEAFVIARDASAKDLNHCEVTVEAIVNYGDSVLVLAKTGASVLRIRLGSAEAEMLREGDTFRVAWRAMDACLLD